MQCGEAKCLLFVFCVENAVFSRDYYLKNAALFVQEKIDEQGLIILFHSSPVKQPRLLVFPGLNKVFL
jgi:hypothetical protein